MSDTDQPGEKVDEDLLEGEYPPEEPLGVEEEGVTGLEQLGGESFEERDERTEPDFGEQPAAGTADRGVELAGADAGVPDEEGQLVGEPVDAGDEGALSVDDEFTGDETTRDVATERSPEPAEEAAVHVDDEPSP